MLTTCEHLVVMRHCAALDLITYSHVLHVVIINHVDGFCVVRM